MKFFNKKTILFFTISSLMINGCMAKSEFETQPIRKVTLPSVSVASKGIWGKALVSTKIKSKKKADCVDCYATPITGSKLASVIKPVSNTLAKVTKTKHYGAYAYTETVADKTVKRKKSKTVNANRYILPAISSTNSASGSYHTYSKNMNTSVQVGAFRRYAGAKIYKKRYNALSNKYKVSIKRTSTKNKPLYRVRIEGFKNKSEARKFLNRYGIRDAFLVRR